MTKKKVAPSIEATPVTATDAGSQEVSSIKGFDANFSGND
jgi:hypothetical protein